jgi:ABC-type dipeptide/oligopeptide/nickel transport system permease subunit
MFVAYVISAIFFLSSLGFFGIICAADKPQLAKWCFLVCGLSNLAVSAWLFSLCKV